MEAAQESSTPEGPASLREALSEAYKEASEQTEQVVTDDLPTDDDAQLDASEGHEAAEADSSEDYPQESADEVIPAPEHWSDEDKATFTELPRSAQQYVLKREKQYEQGIQSKAEELKPIRDAFGGYRDMLKMRGVDEATAIRTWVAAQSMLDQDPVNGLRMLMQQYGPDVAKQVAEGFIESNADETGSDYLDPEVGKLQKQLQDQKQQQSQLEQRYLAEQQQRAAQQVQAFQSATDDNGNLLHPHFDAVKEDMRLLISSGKAIDLDAAYEQAIWLSPDIRQQILDNEKSAAQKAAEKAAAKKREEAAKTAKKVAQGVQGRSSKPPPPEKGKTLRDDLRAAWDQSLRGDL